MSDKRWTLTISGLVQGVCYRASAQEKASSLGLTGYTRNLPDGRVEVVAEGPLDNLQALKAWCGEGPPAARVDTVEVSEGEASGEFRGFGIRH